MRERPTATQEDGAASSETVSRPTHHEADGSDECRDENTRSHPRPDGTASDVLGCAHSTVARLVYPSLNGIDATICERASLIRVSRRLLSRMIGVLRMGRGTHEGFPSLR